MRAFEAAAAGVQLVPEDRRIIAGLTVEENLKLAQISEPRGWEIERVYEHFPRLAERRRQEAVTMSGGEQQMLAVGRALMGRPTLLLLDEPSMGLAPVLVDLIFDTIQTIREQGTTVLLVEQNALAALSVADYAYVLESGTMKLEGPAPELARDSDVVRAYLGG
jgi:branched-chain amino acid transport system ATP-binding protein